LVEKKNIKKLFFVFFPKRER